MSYLGSHEGNQQSSLKTRKVKKWRAKVVLVNIIGTVLSERALWKNGKSVGLHKSDSVHFMLLVLVLVARAH